MFNGINLVYYQIEIYTGNFIPFEFIIEFKYVNMYLKASCHVIGTVPCNEHGPI